MTLEDVIRMEAPGRMIVDDATKITVTKAFRTYGAQFRRSGNWYEDQILNLMKQEIASFNYDAAENRISVVLK